MRMAGAIRSLNKGYGFIAGDDGENYYLHWSAMRDDSKDFRELRLRERINFEVKPPVAARDGKQPSGKRAVDAFIIERKTYTGSDLEV